MVTLIIPHKSHVRVKLTLSGVKIVLPTTTVDTYSE